MVAVQEVEGAAHPHRHPLAGGIVVFGDLRAPLLVGVPDVDGDPFGADAQQPIPISIIHEAGDLPGDGVGDDGQPVLGVVLLRVGDALRARDLHPQHHIPVRVIGRPKARRGADDDKRRPVSPVAVCGHLFYRKWWTIQDQAT